MDYPSTSVERLRTTVNNFSQDSCFLGLDLNLGAAGYNAVLIDDISFVIEKIY